MQNLIIFALLGLGGGALIAGLAVGVVIQYRASNVVNLALGAVAAWGAYIFYGLRTGGYLWLPAIPFLPDRLQLGGPWPVLPALGLTLVCCALLGGLTELLVIRQLRDQSTLAKLLATLGLYLFLQAIMQLRWGSTGQQAPTVLPTGTVKIFGTPLPIDRVALALIVVLVGLALAVLYRFTRFGLATQAAAENETTASVYGLDPNRLSMIASVTCYVVVGGLGVLVAPLTTLDPFGLPSLIVPALAAAVLAGLNSFGIAIAAGLSLGILQSYLTLMMSMPWFPTPGGNQMVGMDDLLFFLVVLLALLLRGKSLPTRGMIAEKRLPAAPPPGQTVRPAIIAVAVVAVAFLIAPYDWRQGLINSLIGIILCLSFVIVVGYVGQVSLLQLGISGVAAFLVSKFAVQAGLGFPLGPIAAVALACLLGVAIAGSALRVRGVNLAILTLAGAVALENFVFNNATWGAGVSGSPVPSPTFLGIKIGVDAPFPINGASQPSPLFGILVALVVIAMCALTAHLRTSSLGHRMLAVRSNERVAASVGIDVTAVKLGAFAISSALAGIAGVLFAYNFQAVTASRFGFAMALSTLAFAYIGGITTVRGAVLAGVGVTGGLAFVITGYLGIPPEFTYVIGGLMLVIVIITKPEGLAARPPKAVREAKAAERHTRRDARHRRRDGLEASRTVASSAESVSAPQHPAVQTPSESSAPSVVDPEAVSGSPAKGSA